MFTVSYQRLIFAFSIVFGFTFSEMITAEQKPIPQKSSSTVDAAQKKAIGQAKSALNYLGMLYATMYSPVTQAQFYGEELALRKQLNAAKAEIIQTLDGTALLVMDKNAITIVYGGLFMGKEGTPQEIRVAEGKKLAMKIYGIPPKFLVSAGYGKAFSGLARVHKGAYEMFTKSWDEIYSHIARYAEAKGQPLQNFNYLIIGHSIGGAVAQLAALRLATLTFKGNPSDHIQLVTFGPARLFDAGLVDFYNGLGLKPHSIAVLNENDTTFDKAPLALGYATPGILLTIPAYRMKGGDPHSFRAYKETLVEANVDNTKLGDPPHSGIGAMATQAKKIVLAPGRCAISMAQKKVEESLIECASLESLMKKSLDAKREEKIFEVIREGIIGGTYKTEQQVVDDIGEGNPQRQDMVRKIWTQLHQEQ